MFSETMSLAKFLSRYANLTGANLNKLTHEDVKDLFPFLKRTSFKEIQDNPELVALGNVVLVSDGRKTIPYYTPELTYEMDENGNYIEAEPEELDMQLMPKKKVNNQRYDYMSLSEKELRNLLIRKLNSQRNQLCARRELKRRGIPITLKYKRDTNHKYGEEEEK